MMRARTRLVQLSSFSPLVALLYIPGSLIYLLAGGPFANAAAVLAIFPLAFLVHRGFRVGQFIDVRLAAKIGSLRGYSVLTKSLPLYRLVDVYDAVDRLARAHPEWIRIESRHYEPLQMVVNGQFPAEANRLIQTPERIARPADYGAERFIPTDTFFAIPRSETWPHIIRVRKDPYTSEAVIEVAAPDLGFGENLVEMIVQNASHDSIYKNKVVEVAFEMEIRDEYGSIARNESVDLIFKNREEVTDDAIILDDDVRKVIERNIFEFHERRHQLMELGVSGKKGVLFYGPPGNGKTYTCKYIAYRLKSATIFVVTGKSLLHAKSICNLARMLQPAIVVLEDVDLVFGAREENLYSAGLGEMLDELDGFAQTDQITFVMTTNAIDRVERAIRERPGRVSQCIYFGPPAPPLRRRYLRRLTAAYNVEGLDFDLLVEKTSGVSQAFLKELVFRSVQIGAGSDAVSPNMVALSNQDFEEALKEMRAGDRSAAAIIGFRTTTEARAW